MYDIMPVYLVTIRDLNTAGAYRVALSSAQSPTYYIYIHLVYPGIAIW